MLKYSWLTMFQVHSKVIQLYVYTCIIFQITFHYRLLQDIVYSSLGYRVKLCCLLPIYFSEFLLMISITSREFLKKKNKKNMYNQRKVCYKVLALVDIGEKIYMLERRCLFFQWMIWNNLSAFHQLVLMNSHICYYSQEY